MKRFWNFKLLGISALAFSLFGLVAVPAQAQKAPASPNFTVASGKDATVRFNVFSLQYGQPFPTGQAIEPYKIADSKTINALGYAVSNDMDNSDPRSLQLALWNLKDNTFHTNSGESSDKAQSILNSANSNSAIPASTGVTLQDAILAKQAKIEVTGLKSLKEGEFYGTAVMKVTNLTDKTLNLTLPFGSTFGVPGSNSQTLIGYVTGTDSSTGTSGANATLAGTPGAAGIVPSTVAGVSRAGSVAAGNATAPVAATGVAALATALPATAVTTPVAVVAPAPKQDNGFPWWLLLIPALLALLLFFLLGRRRSAPVETYKPANTEVVRTPSTTATVGPVESTTVRPVEVNAVASVKPTSTVEATSSRVVTPIQEVTPKTIFKSGDTSEKN